MPFFEQTENERRNNKKQKKRGALSGSDFQVKKGHCKKRSSNIYIIYIYTRPCGLGAAGPHRRRDETWIMTHATHSDTHCGANRQSLLFMPAVKSCSMLFTRANFSFEVAESGGDWAAVTECSGVCGV